MSRWETPADPTAWEDPESVITDGRGVPAASFVSRLAGDENGQDWRDTLGPLPSSNPGLSLAIVTCMDARLDPQSRLGIAVGDAHILRNAGGRVTADVIRSLHLSVGLMNVREIGILHHTGCGLEGVDNLTLETRTGARGIDFLAFQDLRHSVSTDVNELLRAGILPTGGIVWGAVYSLGTHQAYVIRGPITVTERRRTRRIENSGRDQRHGSSSQHPVSTRE
jgi:carbonic anhydrase